METNRTSDGLHIVDPTLQKARAGQIFFASTSDAAVGAGGYLKFTLNNPNGSGKRLIVTRIDVVNGLAVPLFGDVLVNPTTAKPTANTVTPTSTILGSSNTSVAVVKWDVVAAALSGGTVLPRMYTAVGTNKYDQTPLVMPPNTTIGLNFLYTLVTGSITMYWYEENN